MTKLQTHHLCENTLIIITLLALFLTPLVCSSRGWRYSASIPAKCHALPPQFGDFIANQCYRTVASKPTMGNKQTATNEQQRVIAPFVFHNGVWSNKFETIKNCLDQYAQLNKTATENSLKCVTYNVWFDSLAREVRYKAILDIARSHDPDFICLQEVVPSFLKIMCDIDWVKDEYVLTDASTAGNTVIPYGVLIMVHKRVYTQYAQDPTKVELTLHKLPTHMSRSALLCSYTSKNNEKIAVATVHLESLSSRQLRKEQMEIIHRILASSNVALFMGDFNFDSERNWADEDNSEIEDIYMRELFKEYQDTWRELKYKENDMGKTFDTTRNAMIGNQRPEIMRYDRILFKGGNSWQASEIELLGVEVIEDEHGTPIVPSDHFGLMLKCNAKN
jgi:endonuclease/exonuclease/phosphatase family metal-dependent hydrolase